MTSRHRDGDRRSHFSMIRSFHLADVFTLLNGALGAGAVLAFMRFLVDDRIAFFWLGTSFLPVAMVMDALDGRIARRRGVASPLGQELDSLADVVSFGVAPAAMAFAVGLRGAWDALLLIYFVACGISRLARYNVTASAAAAAEAKVKSFEGFPIPTSLLLVALLAVLTGLDLWQQRLPLGAISFAGATLHPLSLLFGLHGSAMISKTLRVPKP
jgi:CDP-diacylglycerol--serine O-phosphatidyltransferase